MILVVANITMPIYAIATLNKLLFDDSIDDREKVKGVKYGVLSLAGLLLILLLFKDSFFSFRGSSDDRMPAFALAGIIADRKALYVNGILLTLLYLGLTTGVLYAVWKKLIQPTHAIIALGIIISIDMFSQSLQYLNNKKDEQGNYLCWQTRDESKVAFPLRPGDIQIYQNELRSNPSLKSAIDQQMQLLPKENDQALQYAQRFALLGLNNQLSSL